VGSQDGVPESLAFLPGADRVVRGVPRDAAFHTAVTIECGNLDRAGTLKPAVAAAQMIIAIDHHEDHRPYAHLTDLDPSAAAVGEQIADLMPRLGIAIDRAIAVNLLTAIATDTGVFRFANTTPRTLRIAADLIERGARLHEVVRAVYEEQPVSALRVLGAALAGVELREDGAIALTVITPAMLQTAAASAEDVRGVAAMLRTIHGVRLALVFEERSNAVQVSIRARDGVRANAVAQALGGGGHPAAAGAEVRRSLPETVALALDAARRELDGSGP
jgi:phosphoesterase RecJ-like protein